ncbi:MAG: prepilin peptidase [Candidatus Scalinduaceae bacterium]
MELPSLFGAIIQIWIFVLGVTIGSFLNVCIYRIPKELSLLWPVSSCGYCNTAIVWYDNIPVLSYLFLKGRCRHCGHKISVRYLVVEIITGLVFCLLFYNVYIVSGESLYVYGIYAIFCCLLIVCSFIDLKLHIIPNVVTYTGLVLAPVASLLCPRLNSLNGSLECLEFSGNQWIDSFLSCLIGIFVAGGLIFLCGVIGKIILKKDAMGFGDVKLMGVIGGFMGWKLGIATFFLAPFLGLLFGLPKLILRKEHLIPYGPFLSLAAFICLLLKDFFISIIDIYINTFTILFSNLIPL